MDLFELSKQTLINIINDQQKTIEDYKQNSNINTEVNKQKELENTITQLTINNTKLNEEISNLRNPPTPLHKKPVVHIVEHFVKECCEWKDCILNKKDIYIAPSNFEDIFYEYKSWCDDNDLIGRVKDITNKKLIKGFAIKIQDESVYGLTMGETIKDGQPNGTPLKLYVNFVVKNSVFD